jgi:heme-degrading monooxygenase HmoA
MSVRVLSERVVKFGMERAIAREMRKMKQKVLSAPGYIGSVSYKDANDSNKHVVLSEW